MKHDIAIKVDNVYKSFKIPHEKSKTLKSAAINIFKKKTYTQHDAAKGISFEVKKGEFLGIVGRNGCGKSTMLKMLAGIYQPDKGKISVSGRLSPFLELGVGFNPELSARNNVYLNGAMLGLSRKEIDEKFDEIIRFAELEEFVDQKLKNFSSGMQVRLAFSVAIRAHAEILLIDEVLAVGDENFKKKCFDIFRQLKNEGRTIVFVSHGMGEIKEFCDRAIMIKDGEIFSEGSVSKVITEYQKENRIGAQELVFTGRKMDEKKALSNLADARDILNKLKLDYFLIDGTLLGMIREKAFIAHDEDTDFGVYAEQWDQEKVGRFIAEAIKKGFNVGHTLGDFSNCFELSVVRDGIKLDLFFYHKKGKKRVFHAFRNSGRNLPEDLITYEYEAELINKRKEAIFYEEKFMIPAEPEKILVVKYGDDWKVSKTNWDWADGPCNKVEA